MDSTDADFVDIMHTNGGRYIGGNVGIFDATGHVDFYGINELNFPFVFQGFNLKYICFRKICIFPINHGFTEVPMLPEARDPLDAPPLPGTRYLPSLRESLPPSLPGLVDFLETLPQDLLTSGRLWDASEGREPRR